MDFAELIEGSVRRTLRDPTIELVRCGTNRGLTKKIVRKKTKVCLHPNKTSLPFSSFENKPRGSNLVRLRLNSHI